MHIKQINQQQLNLQKSLNSFYLNQLYQLLEASMPGSTTPIQRKLKEVEGLVRDSWYQMAVYTKAWKGNPPLTLPRV
jgi:hypothetical protein